MSFRSVAALLLCAVCGLTLTPGTRATTVAPLDLDELVAGADLVAFGRVTHLLEQRAADTRVETKVSIGAATLLKGSSAGAIEFCIPGGRAGRYRTIVPGAPVLRERDEVVIFLRQPPSGSFVLVGFSQGLMPILRDPVTGEARVMAPPSSSSGDVRVTRGDPGRRPVSLHAFAREIQGIVERERVLRELRGGEASKRSKIDGGQR
jgi:hypothetical protein